MFRIDLRVITDLIVWLPVNERVRNRFNPFSSMLQEGRRELITRTCGEKRTAKDASESFGIVSRFGETVDKLAVKFVETVKRRDEFARIRGEFCPSAPFTAR